MRKSLKMLSNYEKKCEDGRRVEYQEGKKNGRKERKAEGSKEGRKEGRYVFDLLLPLQTFLIPTIPIFAFYTAPFPSQLPLYPTVLKASGQGFYIGKTFVWLLQPGTLRRPGLALLGSQLWQLSHPHPEGAGRSTQIPWV